ncbi:hypothetical protein D3C84_445090 [compost metagenome]
MTEFAGHLHQIEAHGMAQFTMAGAGFVQARGFLRTFAPGLGELLAGGLRGGHVPRCCQQNFPGVITQGHSIHIFGRRGNRSGELLPFIDDTVYVLPDEFG